MTFIKTLEELDKRIEAEKKRKAEEERKAEEQRKRQEEAERIRKEEEERKAEEKRIARKNRMTMIKWKIESVNWYIVLTCLGIALWVGSIVALIYMLFSWIASLL